MSQEILKSISDSSISKAVSLVQPGHTVRVHQKIKEGSKERIQIFEGVVIKVNSGTGINKNFTVRKMVDGIGVEKIYPFFSPTLSKVEVVKGGKVRRSKLYYLRALAGKSARLRDLSMGELASIGSDRVEEELVEEELAASAVATPVADAVEETPAVAEEVQAEEVAVEEAPEVTEAPEEEKTEEA